VSEKHTPLTYRPLPHDDWGFIRGANGFIYAIARDGGRATASDDEHRRAGTDPYEEVGREIVTAVNAYDALLSALTEIAKGEGAFSTDQLTHATNCIENMKAIAKAAIAATAGEKGAG
jgi:hypothetical protein